jgi:hypothetical protein
MDWLHIAGDALWILALSLMASASRAAWSKLRPEAKLPLPLVPGVSTSRAVAVCVIPAIAFVAGAILLVAQGSVPRMSEAAVIVFGLRATLAPLFVMAHLRWLGRVMTKLAQEGALKS